VLLRRQRPRPRQCPRLRQRQRQEETDGETFKVKGSTRTLVPNMEHRIAAAQWLSDRAYGRARELIQFASESTAEERVAILRRLSADDRETLRTILGRALAARTRRRIRISRMRPT
jgi:hypothetical protein